MVSLTYRHILLVVILLLPALSFAQKVYDGQVINKITEDWIPNVNVLLLKEKIGTATNAQGYFELSSEKPLPDDTLQFSSVGYKTIKLPVSAYQSQMFIALEASNTRLNEVDITNKRKLKNIVLDKFGYADLKPVSARFYHHSTEVVKTTTVLAKLFKAPKDNVLLLNISLGRQDLPTSPSYSVRNKFTTFLLHIMTQDSLTHAPGKIIFTKTISLTDNALWVNIDLTNDKVRIPSKDFFIAIEWLINPYNEIIEVNRAPKVAKTTKRGFQLLNDVSEYHISYQPFLIGYDNEDDTRVHALLYTRINNQWQLDRQIYKNELALSATIQY
ncbi:carboxypeptidase-like regulatory domain-containing protein [Mucilaginibacter sp. dw_454]|uniref:carboxypeptidase-like regulatory domain-containing protein n=1 Tax=Mucilaginibacter sp. dw_454 TaxID=2720079 RepID=UPI001BD43113|nr:carboxypeptidase-like regulatory domain-containing protein [Mucilaginibacter sp. dw_454]